MISKTKGKYFSKIMSVILSLSVVFFTALTMTMQVSAESANDDVTAVGNSLMQVRMVYTDDDGIVRPVQGGTGFLINSNTVITCAHVVDVDSDTKKALKDMYGNNYNKDKLSLQVVVSGDVTITATIKKESEDVDFAILNLTEAIYERTPASLGNTDDLKATQLVFALGFPASVANLQNKNTYTSSDVTITDGKVSKLNSSDGVDYIQHGAILTGGNSGGPLVDETGKVIGINKGKNDNYYYAININQVTEILDALGIEYNSNSNSAVESSASENETVIEETTVEETTVKPTTSLASTTKNNDDGNNMTKIIIIVAIVVLVIILIIVILLIIMNKNKKSSKKIQAPVQQRNAMPSSGQQNAQMGGLPIQQNNIQTPYGNKVSGGSSQTVVSNDGAGETSVLNDGTGETTVLGYQSPGATLMRKSNGEKIGINKPEFVIGKERRRVDYCINDNNSVSRAHAKIRARAGKYYIADLGSTNCTYVNGAKLSPNQEIALEKGDKIRISDEEFEFLG